MNDGVDAIALRTRQHFAAPDPYTPGYYGDVVLCAPLEPALEFYDRNLPTPYGLHPLHQAWYGVAKGASGRYYNLQRFLHGTMVPRIHLTGWDPGDKAFDLPDAARSFYGYVANEIVDGHWVLSSRGKPGRGMRFDVTPGQGGVWDEEGILHVEMTQIGPAVEMYHADGSQDSYYNGHIVELDGDILGDPIEGVGGFELGWAKGAIEWRELAVPNRIEEQWMIYVTRFADGDYEAGHLFTRADGRGAGLVVRRDGTEVLYGIRGEFECDTRGVPTAIRWEHDGRRWECRTETPSTTSPRNPSYMWQLGQVQREGETRRPVRSWCYAETLPRVLAPAHRD